MRKVHKRTHRLLTQPTEDPEPYSGDIYDILRDKPEKTKTDDSFLTNIGIVLMVATVIFGAATVYFFLTNNN